MTRRLVFVHGRAQEGKDAVALKGEWIAALRSGLQRQGLSLPVPESHIRFPYYGDTLAQLCNGMSPAQAAAVIVRGDDSNEEEKRFARAMVEEMRHKAGITDAQVAAAAGQAVVEKGVLNQAWFQAVLLAMDRYVPLASGASIALFTHDVYQYLKDETVREEIDEGVSAAMEPGVETVVVSHSLGTVVAYRLLRLVGQARGWKVPLFITLGSPLAVQEIRKALRSAGPTRCPECAGAWFNAMDERDVVALYPLDAGNFPLDPAVPSIENKLDVDNHTENRHGIAGYLDDPSVAKRIHDALIGQG